MKQRTIDILKYCSLPVASDEFMRARAEAYERYGFKAVASKLEDLARKGYIEYGTSLNFPWLTDKGKSALEPHLPRHAWFLTCPVIGMMAVSTNPTYKCAKCDEEFKPVIIFDFKPGAINRIPSAPDTICEETHVQTAKQTGAEL
jgi:hypothetical protein